MFGLQREDFLFSQTLFGTVTRNCNFCIFPILSCWDTYFAYPFLFWNPCLSLCFTFFGPDQVGSQRIPTCRLRRIVHPDHLESSTFHRRRLPIIHNDSCEIILSLRDPVQYMDPVYKHAWLETCSDWVPPLLFGTRGALSPLRMQKLTDFHNSSILTLTHL